MKRIRKIILYLAISSCLLIKNIAYGNESLPKLFLFLGGDSASNHAHRLDHSCVSGAQIIYSWKQLEPKKGVYDFSKIENDLQFLKKIHKKLFIQLQDRSFEPTLFNVPDYIREEKEYHGGVAMQYDFPGQGQPITTGWVARVWDKAVQERYHLLIQKLSQEFDGKIEGINLPETAVDFDVNHLPEGFTADNYFRAELENIKVVRQAFKKSHVMQYVNFFPNEWNNDHHYMSQLFSFASTHQIGLGGPDVVPYKTAHMQNSYPFFHQYQGQIQIGMAIQEPDYTYINPKTDKKYTFAEFYAFTHHYLGATRIFWNMEEPFFSNELLPNLDKLHFECS